MEVFVQGCLVNGEIRSASETLRRRKNYTGERSRVIQSTGGFDMLYHGCLGVVTCLYSRFTEIFDCSHVLCSYGLLRLVVHRDVDGAEELYK